MKRGKIIFGAICAVFAAMAFIGCQPTTGGGSSALAPFAGTTWQADGVDDLVFNANGTVVYVGEDCTYTVSQDGDAYIASIIVEDTVMAKLTVATVDATSAELTVYPWVQSPSVYTKEGAESAEPEPAEPEPGERPVVVL